MTKEKPAKVASKKDQLLIASGLVPLLFACKTEPNYLPLLYSLFVLAFFFSKKHTSQEKPDSKTLSTAAGLFCLNLTLLGLLAEALALFSNGQTPFKQNPDFFQAQLSAIISGGAGFYLGWALAVCIVGRLSGFNLPLALISGLYPPLLALLPQRIGINCWQALNLAQTQLDYSSTFFHGFLFATLAGLAYLSSFGQLTTSVPCLTGKAWFNRLRSLVLLTLLMSLGPWSLAWLFLQAAKLFQHNF